MTTPMDSDDLWHALANAEAAPPVDALDAVTDELAAALHTDRVAFLIAELGGRTLVRLGHGPRTGSAEAGGSTGGRELARTVPFDSGEVERTLREQRVTTDRVDDGWRVLAPVSQRGEVIGLLEVYLSRRPDAGDLRSIGRFGRVLAHVVIANRRHTDLFEWGQRAVPFELSAELQRRLLPAAFTCEARDFVLSAWLEPAATIGGDTFDYSLDRDTLHLSVTDAMGHGVGAALTASIAVGALRNGRRAGVGLAEQVGIANDAVVDHRPDTFCTGVVGRIDLATGLFSAVNAGHISPLLLRDGRATEIDLVTNLPLGIRRATPYTVSRLALRPGDRLVILTDGMVERAATDVDLRGLVETTVDVHPREATRRLSDAVIAVSHDGLPDDATVLIVDWHGTTVAAEPD